MLENIVVHEKALGHLTRGLYRSPASALRELVSNAWDANATEVRIDTSRPTFHRISVLDNGDGFSKEDFQNLMKGFGNSEKRAPNAKKLKYGRPTIGRLGIGLLGIAQICGSFRIRSRPKNGDPFAAQVILYDELRRKIDVDDAAVVKQSRIGRVLRGRRREVVVGQYEFTEFDGEPLPSFGTLIESEDLIPTFSYAFQKTYEDIREPPASAKAMGARRKRHPIPESWLAFLERAATSATVQQLGDYWRWLWELSALVPIPYISAYALPRGVVAEHHRRLTRFRFSVFVDGLEIRKPAYIPRDNRGGFTSRRIERTTRLVMKRKLTYSGYVLVQEGKQIRPAELRGVLARISEVGVGLYDPSFLDYRINEGPRSRWITSELFVEEGLEDALNVDRDSFNRYAAAFQVLQRDLHLLLQKQVFPAVYKQIEVRTKARRGETEKGRLTALTAVLSDYIDKELVITQKRSHGADDKLTGGVDLSETRSGVRLLLSPGGLSGTAKSYRSLGAAIIAIYDAANRETDDRARRDRFVVLLRDLLRNW